MLTIKKNILFAFISFSKWWKVEEKKKKIENTYQTRFGFSLFSFSFISFRLGMLDGSKWDKKNCEWWWKWFLFFIFHFYSVTWLCLDVCVCVAVHLSECKSNNKFMFHDAARTNRTRKSFFVVNANKTRNSPIIHGSTGRRCFNLLYFSVSAAALNFRFSF